MDYRYLNKRKTLTLGGYSAVPLAKAGNRRDQARDLLTDEIAPAQNKRDKKLDQVIAATNTF